METDKTRDSSATEEGRTWSERGLRMLLADEDRSWAEAVAALLADHGLRLDVVDDGIEAVRLASSRGYEVVWLGCFLKRVDGDLVARCLREGGGAELPRVVMVSSDPDGIDSEVMTAVDGAVGKASPGDTARLILEAVRRLAEGGSLLDGKRVAFARKGWEPRAESRRIEVLKRRLACLYGALPGMVFVLDGEGRVVYVNDEAIVGLGSSLSKILGAALDDVIDVSRESRLHRTLKTAAENRDFRPVEFPLEWRSRVFTCRIGILPVVQDSHGVLLSLVDVTDRHMAQRELLRSQVLLEQLFQGSGGAICVVGIDYRITKINANFEKLLGLPASRILGEHCHDVFPGVSCRTEECSLRRIQRGEAVTTEETERTNAAGDVISCLLTASPIRLPDGKLSGVMKDFRDITEMKRLRAVAEAKTEASNIGYVFSGIRHEIGNPINSCKMTLSVLSDNLETFPPETAKEFLRRALGEVVRVEQLLRALRNFSVKEKVHLSRGDLQDFLEDLGRLLGAECQRRGIDFQAELDPAARWAVFDPQALHQVLIHLFSNAVDALADTAEPAIRLASRKRSSDVRILFADNGCGIDQSVREHLFKPFFTSKPKGVGMGLAIAKKLVAAMHGTVTISGAPGGGATVEIVLPLEEEDSDHEAPKPAHH